MNDKLTIKQKTEELKKNMMIQINAENIKE